MARYIWLWNAQGKWTQYSDIEIELIEDAFQQKQTQVELDDCCLDLEGWKWTSKIDKRKTGSIQRKLIDNPDARSLRRERFFTPEFFSTKSFDDDWNCCWLTEEWLRNNGSRPKSEKVELTAKGILIEGKQLGHLDEARRLARQLENVKDESDYEIAKCCVLLYTQECFLYKLLNEILRNEDRTKINTLGGFCALLKWSPFYMKISYHGVVYRGMQLNEKQFNEYRQAVDTGRKAWLGFTSTSKNQIKAAQFGNTLFIISIPSSRSRGFDISSISAFVNEEEVILPSSCPFRINKVHYEETNGKYLIYVTID